MTHEPIDYSNLNYIHRDDFSTYEAKLAWIVRNADDPEIRSDILNALGIASPPPPVVGMAPLSRMTSLQVSFFDNRQKVKRSARSTERDFGLCVETWVDDDEPGKRNKASTTNIILFTKKEFVAKLRRSEAKNLSEDWKDSMGAMAEEFGVEYLYGPVVTRLGGYRWVEGQFVIARQFRGRVIEVIIFQPDDAAGVMRIENFATTYVTGEPLKPGIMATARCDLSGSRPDWTTISITGYE